MGLEIALAAVSVLACVLAWRLIVIGGKYLDLRAEELEQRKRVAKALGDNPPFFKLSWYVDTAVSQITMLDEMRRDARAVTDGNRTWFRAFGRRWRLVHENQPRGPKGKFVKKTKSRLK